MKCVVSALRGVSPEGVFVAPRALKYGLFGFMVAVILSQNTSDKNALRAFEALAKATGMDPARVVEEGVDGVKSLIRVAGLAEQRAGRIVELARMFIDGRMGDWVCRLGVEEARRFLLSIKGVGDKTADLVLLMYCGLPSFPVDTHIMRVCSRVCIGRTYRSIRRAFLSVVKDPGALLEAHVKLISIGRIYCRPRRPRCSVCPLRECCGHASPPSDNGA